ncbi:MAG: heat-inducible transcription repressor HrcA [Deltaproteobacteria bacterium]|nr:heat-inducible transcription repressor HrcA [Deltaproteobacteria bacterium]
MTTLTERAEKILIEIVKVYISTAGAVSSGSIAKTRRVGLSPASVRNVMAELERQGYITRPHASSGRVPTDKGFRLYVDSLLEVEEPREDDKHRIRACCENTLVCDGMVRGATRMLSSITSCAGFVLVPRRAGFLIRHVRFLPVDDSFILVVIVSTNGIVNTRPVRREKGFAGIDLEKASNYLNSFSAGLTMEELRDRVMEEMGKERNLYDGLFKAALRLGLMIGETAASNGDAEGDIYVEGRANIFDQPEFAIDIERMKRVFAAFEEKSLLVRILDESIKERGVRISIGSECDTKGFEGLSLVAASYGKDESALGTVGVIGPVRMNYPRIIPLVNYAAGLLTEAL